MGTRRVCYGQVCWHVGAAGLGSRLHARQAPLSLLLPVQEQVEGPWYHPSAQETQPLFGEHTPDRAGGGWVKTLCCLADPWHGGSSLLLHGEISPEADRVTVRWVSAQGMVQAALPQSLCVGTDVPQGHRCPCKAEALSWARALGPSSQYVLVQVDLWEWRAWGQRGDLCH